MINSSRRNIRFPAQVDTVEIISRTPARVVDESLSGIALVLDQSLAAVIGDEVNIDYGGGAMPAIIRRVNEQDDGSWLIGLQWK
jgi:hypothetical protein